MIDFGSILLLSGFCAWRRGCRAVLRGGRWRDTGYSAWFDDIRLDLETPFEDGLAS